MTFKSQATESEAAVLHAYLEVIAIEPCETDFWADMHKITL